MLWVVLVAAVVFVLLSVRRWKLEKFITLSKQLKSSVKSYPFIGHAYLFAGDGVSRMQAFQQLAREAIQNGGATSLWLGDNYFVTEVDAADIEVVMKSALEKHDVMRFARKLIGNGAIFAPVAIWRPRRKVLAPTFSPKNLNTFVDVFTRQSSTMVDLLKSKAGKGVLSVWHYLTTYTLDSVCETTLGVTINAQQNPNEPFLKSFEQCAKLVAARMVQPWLYSDLIYSLLPLHTMFERHKRVVCDFIDEAVRLKREELKELNNINKKTHDMKTFLELLIQNSGGDRGYSDLELHEETLVIVAAGTDTSAVGTSFALCMLARHPEVQDKAVQELHDVFGNSERPLCHDDLPRLKYLDAVLKETLRLYPPVPVIVRKIEADLKLPSGLHLVNGCGVLINIWGTHRNPKYWGEDAEEFRPERFIEAPLKHPAAFLAFSHGPRSCIGYQYAMMSMKTVLATVLRNYRILSVDPGVDIAHKPLTVAFDVMMKDVDGFQVQLERRK